MQEFNRTFDIGVFHHREAWLSEAFGRAESEGGRFVKFSLTKLGRTKPWLVPFVMFRFGMRYLGFKLGYFEHNIPHHLKSRLSMNKGFWKDVSRNDIS
jgi:rhamnosyltransferase